MNIGSDKRKTRLRVDAYFIARRTHYPMVLYITSDIFRYIIGVVVALISLTLALVAFNPLGVKVKQVEVEDEGIIFAKSLMTRARSSNSSV